MVALGSRQWPIKSPHHGTLVQNPLAARCSFGSEHLLYTISKISLLYLFRLAINSVDLFVQMVFLVRNQSTSMNLKMTRP